MLRLRWAPVGVTTIKVKARSGKVGLHSVSRGSDHWVSGGIPVIIITSKGPLDHI